MPFPKAHGLLFLPTEARCPTQAPAKLNLGAAPSPPPPQKDLSETHKCPIPQSQDYQAELMLGGHFLDTSRVCVDTQALSLQKSPHILGATA